MPKTEMSGFERRFVEHYVSNPAQARLAARKAGMAESVVKARAYAVLNRPLVKQELDQRFAEVRERTMIDQNLIVRDVMELSHYDIGAVAKLNPKTPEDIAALPPELRRSIRGWAWDRKGNLVLQFYSRLDALAQLIKLCGMDRKVDPDDVIAAQRMLTPEQREALLNAVLAQKGKLLDEPEEDAGRPE